MLLGPLEDPTEYKITVLNRRFRIERWSPKGEVVYAHSTVHTEPICDGQGEKARFDGKRQGKLGHDRVLTFSRVNL